MKQINKIFKFIFTVDLFVIWIATISLSLTISAFATFLKPENFGAVFKTLFAYSAFSFLSVYLVAKLIESLFFSNFTIKFMWLIAIISGSFLSTYFFLKYFLLPASLEIFFGYLLIGLIPSAIFRFTVNFAISYWQERKDFSALSVTK